MGSWLGFGMMFSKSGFAKMTSELLLEPQRRFWRCGGFLSCFISSEKPTTYTQFIGKTNKKLFALSRSSYKKMTQGTESSQWKPIKEVVAVCSVALGTKRHSLWFDISPFSSTWQSPPDMLPINFINILIWFMWYQTGFQKRKLLRDRKVGVAMQCK